MINGMYKQKKTGSVVQSKHQIKNMQTNSFSKRKTKRLCQLVSKLVASFVCPPSQNVKTHELTLDDK